MNIKNLFAPSATGLGGAATPLPCRGGAGVGSVTLLRRAALVLLMMVLTTATALAGDVTVTSVTTSWDSGNTYNVTSNVTISDAVTVTGAVTLNISSGMTLNVNSGITVSDGGLLTVTGQGTLNVRGKDGLNYDENDGTPTGGTPGVYGNITVYGGNVTINGGRGGNNNYGSDHTAAEAGGYGVDGVLTVYGGTVRVTGGGGGNAYYGGQAKVGVDELIVYDGNVKVNGGDGGNGHFGGDSGAGVHNITVNGGTVEINGGHDSLFHEILCTAAFGTITYADMIVAEEKYNYDNDFELLNGNKSQASHLRFHQDFIQDGDTWTINHNVGWNYFCDLLANNDKGYFTGKTVKLGADIGTAENPVIRMAGETHHDFTGTFDGDGHKLTFNYNGIADGVAPFLYVDGCTIENLHVDGSITNFGTRAAGIVARQNGEVTIRNCRSSVIIKSDNIKKGYHGGLVSKIENYATLNIVGCVFDGKMLGRSDKCGGFVGDHDLNGTVNISNSLFAPAEVSFSTLNSATFAQGTEPIVTNSYYTRTLGTAQGTAAFAYTSEPDGIGTEGPTYDVSGITAYTNGIKYGTEYYIAAPTTLSLAANLVDGNYWTTFYCSATGYGIDAGENACTYTATVSGTEITLHRLGKVIPQGTAVIIVGEDASIGITTSAAEAENTVENDLHGVDVATAVSSVMTGAMAGCTPFVLSYKDGTGFGFFEYTGANLPAQKAFLAIDETNLEALARGLTMTFGDDATGIHEITDPTPGPSPAWEGSSAWFTLDGRKLGTKPTQKGVYIYKGKKRVIE